MCDEKEREEGAAYRQRYARNNFMRCKWKADGFVVAVWDVFDRRKKFKGQRYNREAHEGGHIKRI